MIYDLLTKDSFTEIKLGNIYYELKEAPFDIENKIPYNNLIEELQHFLTTIPEDKSNHDFTKDMHEDVSSLSSCNDFGEYINADQCLAMTINYNENYTLKDLQKIAEYYEISTRKMNKAELIEKILAFEDNDNNKDKTFQRKKLWEYMKQIKKDKYLKQFLIIDSPVISR